MRSTLGKFGPRRATRAVIAYNDPPPPPQDGELERLKFEADQARAEAAKAKALLEEEKKNAPTAEQRAKWAELEAEAARAEEERAVKKGEFDTLKGQLTTRYEREIEAHKAATQNAVARAEALDKDIDEEMIAREFAQASGLFGPTGKTIWFPELAQAYFRKDVAVEKVEQNGRTTRRVIVKDTRGATILDKQGGPMVFAKAMEELIESHPQRDSILRGSGKSGPQSPGGSHGAGGSIDTSRLKQSDFSDPKVRDAVRDNLATAGGLQIAPAFDRMRRSKGK